MVSRHEAVIGGTYLVTSVECAECVVVLAHFCRRGEDKTLYGSIEFAR